MRGLFLNIVKNFCEFPLTAVSRDNITSELQEDFVHHSIKPKLGTMVNSALFLIALTFFYFAAVKSRYLTHMLGVI